MSVRLPAPEVRGFVGTAGSGKTWAMQRLMAATIRQTEGWAFVALDLNAEIPSAGATRGRPPIRFTRVDTPAAARAAIEDGRRLVCLTPPPGAELAGGWDARRPYAPLADELARLAVEAPRPVVVVIPEAHTSCREGYPLPHWVGQIAHRSRHVGAGCWWDTQHFADVSKDLLRASVSGLYLFANAGGSDLERVRRMGGPELVEAVEEAGRRAAKGQPGWHVRLSTLDRRPPYRLTRA